MPLQIENFAFDARLIRIVRREDEPWFVGIDVCAALELSKPENALSSLNDDERYTLTEGVISDQRGPRARIIISEPGVYRLVFRSRKPEAERFKRWLAHEVLPQLRKSGRIDVPAPPMAALDVRTEPLIHRLQLVREARAIHGREVAKAMWRQLGLPAVPPPPPTAIDEARVCLRHLLDAMPPGGEAPLRDHLHAAIDESEFDRQIVMCAGLRPVPERDGFLVANAHPFLDDVFRGTQWSRGRHMRVLRRLPGTSAVTTTRFMAHQRRATFVPGEHLDEEVRSALSFAS